MTEIEVTRKIYLRERKSRVENNTLEHSQDDNGDDEDIDKDSRELQVSRLLVKSDYASNFIKKWIKQPSLGENASCWIISRAIFAKLDQQIGEKHFSSVKTLVKRCAQYLDHLVLVLDQSFECGQSPHWPNILELISAILQNAVLMSKLTIKYHKVNRTDSRIRDILQILQQSGQKTLTCMKLVGDGDGVITKSEFDLIIALGENQLKWTKLELGNSLWEDVGCSGIQRLLEVTKDNLESLVIHGGLKGIDDIYSGDKIKFPAKMCQLKKFSICPKYNYVSAIQPGSTLDTDCREIYLDSHEMVLESIEKPLKVSLDLDHCDFPKLNKVVLGTVVELEHCGFSVLRKLKTFRCGSRWDLAVRLAMPESRKRQSTVSELQFPDGLKEAAVLQRTAKFFPNLKKVWIFLPSQAVLQEFFNTYNHSATLEELYIRTQFDFEGLLESCLFPQLKNNLSNKSKVNIEMLQEYLHCGDFIQYYNIELPVQDKERASCLGVGQLKSLKILYLEHVPRKLQIPDPEDLRRWYDHDFKYTNITIGFDLYPISLECHERLLKLNLKEYSWKNFKIPYSSLGSPPYLEYDPDEILSSDDTDHEDLFVPMSGKKRKSVKVSVKPSMLKHDNFIKTEQDDEF